MKGLVSWSLAVPMILGVAHAATVTVTGTGDLVAVDGAVTLREALASINGGADLNADVVAIGAYGTDDRIEFAIPGAGVHTLQPATELPALAVPMTIDGYTQPGASPNTQAASDDAVLRIEIDGTGVVPGSVGLRVVPGGSGSTIRGLVINRFPDGPGPDAGSGIVLLSADDCVIAGNFVGTAADGTGGPTGSSGNLGPGVRAVDGASGNRIGGAAPADRNLISGNSRGVQLRDGAGDNLVQGNFIGVDASGLGVLPQTLGVSLQDATTSGNVIGGSGAGEGNVISGNTTGIGILLGATFTEIRGNLIGTDPQGLVPVPNSSNGIRIDSLGGPGSNSNTIGGTQPERSNVIAFNGSNGIALVGSGGGDNLSNTIRGNRIFANGLLGIDLDGDGVTPNDPGDVDTGHNNLQNYPVLDSAVSMGGSTTITGTLDSAPSFPFLVSFYASPACDPSGFGEGQTYLGFDTVVTDGAGIGPIATVLPVEVPPGWVVTAVASVSDPTGDSSEFSACVATPGGPGALEIPALGPLGLLTLCAALAAAAILALRRGLRVGRHLGVDGPGLGGHDAG